MNLNTRVTATTEQISADLQGEAVILHLKSGVYYGLNPVGALVWQQLEQPRTVGELRDAVLAEYAVDARTCEQDLYNLLGDLQSSGLVETADEPSA